jgi:carbonic anhydrase/acetyltransferase-like protein (isoleucine patch superfamily)
MDTAGVRKLNENIINASEGKLFPYLEFFPKIHKSVFLGSGVKIIGNVEIGENSSVWYNTVIRGDVHYIKIGVNTNVQDCSILYVTNGKFPLNIGNKVTIGHSVNLYGCTLQDLCLIGIGSIVLDGAVIEENAMVAAGTVIILGFIVPSGKLAAGVPAKIIRDLSTEEIADIENSAFRYISYSSLSLSSLKK